MQTGNTDTDERLQLPIDDTLQERTVHGSKTWPIQYYVDQLHRFENQEIPLHWHHELEFWVVFRGAAEIQIGADTLSLFPGEGIFINSNVFHSYRQISTDGFCDCPNIVFSEELLSYSGSVVADRYVTPVLLNKRLPYLLLKRDTPWQARILDDLDRIFSLLQTCGAPSAFGPPPLLTFHTKEPSSDCYELQIQALLSLLWKELFTHHKEAELSGSVPDDSELQLRMQKMLALIREQYMHPITLPEIARAANISKSECSRCFHYYFKTSPMEYVIDYRIKKAKHALLFGNEKLEHIATKTGFSSVAYFCRVFKRKTGMTPSAYKRK